jgi:Amt family ammonium transporter
LLLMLAPLAWVGLALVNTGLGRSRNAAHSMLGAVVAIASAACAYAVAGHCWQGSAGEGSRILTISGKPWDWLGASAPFLSGLALSNTRAWLAAWMGFCAVCLSALIPLGSGMERWRLNSIAASSAILGGLVFPLFAHWAWAGGWLAGLGRNFGLGVGFVDAGGAGVIHASGGLTALALVWILGPRRGKYGHDGMPMAIPGHNVVYTLAGCILALAGWTALNGTGAILFAGADGTRLPLVAVNTLLGAAGAGLVAAAITRVRFGRPDASLTANGWVGGLVATSAGCAFFPPAGSLLTGMLAGAAVTFAVELLELRLDVDDPGGSISVHAVGGLWGLLAAGLLGRFPAGDTAGQVTAQIVGIGTLLGFVLPLAWGLNWLLDRTFPQRVPRDGERQGLDLYELGAGAYPDFVTHSEDFGQR